MNFKELGLSEQTIKAIDEHGITKPTTVQIDVIPSILEGKDIFTIVPGGCGKTCSYVFPLIDIISRRQGQNILIITADSAQSVSVSDQLAIFNKYHEINEELIRENQQEINHEANVIIAAPDLLLDIAAEGKIDLSVINILVVDDINLIKKTRQLPNLEKILEMLPADKQNIVFTNRRSRETQDILDKILKTPAEIKIDRTKEDETAAKAVGDNSSAQSAENTNHHNSTQPIPDKNERRNNRGRRGGRNNRSRANSRASHAADNLHDADSSNKQSQENQSTPNVEAKKPRQKRGGPEEARAENKEGVQNHEAQPDFEAIDLIKRYKTFGDKIPEFLLIKGEVVPNEY